MVKKRKGISMKAVNLVMTAALVGTTVPVVPVMADTGITVKDSGGGLLTAPATNITVTNGMVSNSFAEDAKLSDVISSINPAIKDVSNLRMSAVKEDTDSYIMLASSLDDPFGIFKLDKMTLGQFYDEISEEGDGYNEYAVFADDIIYGTIQLTKNVAARSIKYDKIYDLSGWQNEENADLKFKMTYHSGDGKFSDDSTETVIEYKAGKAIGNIEAIGAYKEDYDFSGFCFDELDQENTSFSIYQNGIWLKKDTDAYVTYVKKGSMPEGSRFDIRYYLADHVDESGNLIPIVVSSDKVGFYYKNEADTEGQETTAFLDDYIGANEFAGFYDSFDKDAASIASGTVVTSSYDVYVHTYPKAVLIFLDNAGNEVGKYVYTQSPGTTLGDYITSFPDGTFYSVKNADKVITSETPVDSEDIEVLADDTCTMGDLVYPKAYVRMAKGSVKTYTVTFDANGGEIDDSNSFKVVADGSTIGTLPVPFRAGFAFSGWYTGQTDGTLVKAAETVNSDITLYAHWRKIVVKNPVTSLALNHEEMTVNYGDELDLTYTYAPSNADNVPCYWTSSDEAVIRVTEGGRFIYTGSGDVTLTAHTADDAMSASVLIHVQSVKKPVTTLTWDIPEQELVLDEEHKVDLGYHYGPSGADNAIFEFTSSNPDVIRIVRDGTAWAYGGKTGTTVLTISTTDKTISADCQIKVKEKETVDPTPDQDLYHVLTLNDGAGNLITESVLDDTDYDLEVPVREGYTFDGWYLMDGTKVDSVHVVSDMTVYGRWTKNKDAADEYVVTFDAQNGNPVIKTSYKDGQSLGVLPVVTYDGYIFKGWYDAIKNGQLVDENTVVNKDVTLYAVWEKEEKTDSYVVTLDDNNNHVWTYDVKKGDAFTDFTKPERAGYTFIGWFTEKEDGQEVTSYEGDSDVTFYAHWKEDTEPSQSVDLYITYKGEKLTSDSVEIHDKDVSFDAVCEPEQSLVWSSSNESVIKVEDNKLVYVGAGETVLKVDTEDGKQSAMVAVTIYDDASSSTDKDPTQNDPHGNTPGDNDQSDHGSQTSGNDEAVYSYELNITMPDGTKKHITSLKSNKTLEELAKALGYENIAWFSVKTFNSNETKFEKSSLVKSVADLTVNGDVLVIAMDANGNAIGSAKVTKTADNKFDVTLSKDTNVALSGTSKSDTSGVASGAKAKGSDSTPLSNGGKGDSSAAATKTSDSNVLPLFGTLSALMVGMLSSLAVWKKKRS